MADLTAEILQKVKTGQLTIEEAQHQLKTTHKSEPYYKVSPKGAISFYGIRRLPVTLYLEELQQIMAMVNCSEFQQFITEHKTELNFKKK